MEIKISELKKDFPEILPIAGVEIFSCCSGMRYKKDDLFLAFFPEKSNVAGVFTKSSMPGEPVVWCKEILSKQTASALLVNSGYANVFCGKAGKVTVEKSVKKLAEKYSVPEDEIYISSTGIIGEPINDDMLLEAVDSKLSGCSFIDAADAIGTTDTFPKGTSVESEIAGVKVSLCGIAKGSGMIAPDMATMLAFTFTDANISKQVLKQLLDESVGGSYNSITVDSDTSTSDMVLAFATCKASHSEVVDITDPDFQDFRNKFHQLNKELAELVVRDGEGATKLIKVKVEGAENDESARKIALSIANSPLVKTAVAGEDPNWGRIVMAIGKSGEKANRDETTVSIGDIIAAEKGALSASYSEDKASEYMKNKEINISVNVAVGEGCSEVYTSDLTHGYISINADYRS